MTIEELKNNYNHCMQMTKDFIQAFPWESREAYGNWLAQSYHFVSHSTRLLAYSAAMAPLGENVLHKRMLQHIAEEIGHEMMALSDLKKLNLSKDDFPEMNETKNFYQSQYYFIQNQSAESFIGYVLFLEGLASTQGFFILNRVTTQFGEKSSVFVKVHAEEDQGHIQSAFDLVSKLPQETYQSICDNMIQSCMTYKKMMEEISFQVALKSYAKDAPMSVAEMAI